MSTPRLCIVSTSRADYGCLVRLIQEVHADADLELQLFVWGEAVAFEKRRERRVTDEGVPVNLVVDAMPVADTPAEIGVAAARALEQLARFLGEERPDVLVVLGDRFEILAPVMAAVVHNIPVAHIHGGELTLGAIDDRVRHAVTKLARLHFVATERYAERVRQMGEPAESVHCVGAPALDSIRRIEPMSAESLGRDLGIPVGPGTAIVTLHPETMSTLPTAALVAEVLAALSQTDLLLLFTASNADHEGSVINRAIQDFVASVPERRRFVDTLGLLRYVSCMAHCGLVIGNSSSGLLEAPSFELPAVNIGHRQDGRVRAANVIDVECDRERIVAAIAQARSAGFRASLRGLRSPYDPYGDGRASWRIKETIKTRLRHGLSPYKGFVDIAPDIRA